MALSTNPSTASSSTSSRPASDGSTVDLMDLAAAAVACTVSASRAILKIADPGADGEKNTRTKNDGSFVTDADVAAQFVIVQALRTVSQTVQIVGEESQEEMEQLKGDYPFLDQDILSKTKQELSLRRRRGRTPESGMLPLGAKGYDPTEEEMGNPDGISLGGTEGSRVLNSPTVVDVSRLCIIVDPLDGTKSYAHGEYDAVSILIAIILDNKPYFGVVGKPFGYFSHPPILDTSCVTIYGGPLINGVFVAGGKEVRPNPIATVSGGEGETSAVAQKDLPRAVISSSRSKGVVEDFCLHLGEKGLIYPEPLLISGAGEKSLRLVLQQQNEAIWFYPKPGTSLWDVAAPDALLRSLGGKLTDKFGNEMDYSKGRDDYENMDGVVACIDATLHARCIQLFQQGDWLNQR